MFDSDILEVAIGLAMVFALVSTICTAVRESVESFLKTRASFLEFGIRQLLNDPHARRIAKDVFDHPLVAGLYIGNFEQPNDQNAKAAAADDPPKRTLIARNRNLPSYIPAKNFAEALIDVIARGPATDIAADSSSQPITLERFRGNLAHIDNPHLRRALLSALDSAAGDLNRLRTNLETWYDSAMERVSGWYKRTTHQMLFIIALVVAVVLNVNTITIGDYLFRHDTMRTALVASIEARSADNTLQESAIEKANQSLDAMHLPIGWTGDEFWDGWGAPRTRAERVAIATPACEKKTDEATKNECWKTAKKVRPWEDVGAPLIGWLLTAFAATLGAPFWFDVLSKFMTVRSTVKPREADKKEAAKVDDTTTQPGSSMAGSSVASSSMAAAPNAAASAAAHAIDDQCSVGTGMAVTPDDQLPAASGGVA